LDTETSGVRFWKDRVFGVSICSPGGDGFYFDLRADSGARRWLAAEVPRCKLVVCHNAKFDQHFSREAGIIFPEGRVFCTMIAAAVINEHEFQYSLEALASKYTTARKRTGIYEELAKIFGGKPTAAAQAPNFHRAPPALIGPYAIDDTIATNHLYKDYCLPEIEKQGLQQVIALEMELLPAIVRMEKRGVRVDIEQAETALKTLEKQEKQIQRELNKIAGFEVNPNPSNSTKELFKPKKDPETGVWTLIDGTVCESTEAGAASIDADCLRSMKHPAAAVILKLRKMKRMTGTFLRGHILGHHDNGVIHANINQTKSDNDKGTGTGRFSINDPALQQIHNRDVDIASVIRAMFIPEYGHDWVCNDWAQMDFRVFAHYVKNQKILEMYAQDANTDFHQLCADITGLPRSPRFAGDANAKQINLGLVFGMGPGKLAAEMGLPYTVETYSRGNDKKQYLKPGKQAQEVFKTYHRGIPGVKDMLENATAVAKSRGYVKTIIGRHIRFPRGMFTHKAGGLIFQGSAADALKVKIIQVDRYFEEARGEKGYLCLNVHDEFDSIVPHGRIDVHEDISRIVTDFHSEDQPIKFRVPIKTEQGVGPNWWIACK
jgi:DNA polymerase I